jgi:hypothetical protein
MTSAYAGRKAPYRLRRAWGDLSTTLLTSRLVRLYELSRILLFSLYGGSARASLRARSVPAIPARNYVVLRTGKTREKRQVNGRRWQNRRS